MLKKKEKEILKKGELLSTYTTDSFRNRKGKIITADELSFLGAGQNSSVWKYKDKDKDKISAFKIFFSDRRGFGLLDGTYLRMQKLPLQRILNAKDAYECITDTSKKYYWLDAYLMDYIEMLKNISILDVPTLIFLENIRLLEEDIKILSENKIKMLDISPENSILNSNYELYLCDTDMYENVYSSDVEVEEIIMRNKIEFTGFIKKYLAKALKDLEVNGDLSRDDCIREIFQIDRYRSLELDTYNGLEELFGNYETPKEYFLSMRK